MARCPKCNTPISWWQLLSSNTYSEIECRHCHADLRFDRKRNLLIGGVFFILLMGPMIPALHLELPSWWFVAIGPLFLLAWLGFAKLEPVAGPVVVPHSGEREVLQQYLARRRKRDAVLIGIIVTGMAVWLLDAFVFNSRLSETMLLIILLVMFVCLVSLYVTQCPFCRKITLNLHNVKTCRYCHRRINR